MKFPRPRLDPEEFVFKIREMNVHKYQITRIEIYPEETIYTAVDILEPCTIRFYENEIGEYVFLTQREAEKLNEKMKEWDKYAEK